MEKLIVKTKIFTKRGEEVRDNLKLVDMYNKLVDMYNELVDTYYEEVNKKDNTTKNKQPVLQRCDNCGSPEIFRKHSSSGYFVKCNDCGVSTDKYMSEAEAVQAWNNDDVNK